MATTAPVRVTDLVRRHRLDVNTVADPGTGYAQLMGIVEAKLIMEQRTVSDETFDEDGAMREEVTGYSWRVEIKMKNSLNAAGTVRDTVHAFLRTKFLALRTAAAAQSEFGIRWYDRNGITGEAHEGRVYVKTWTPEGPTSSPDDITIVLQGQGQIADITNPASSQLPGITSLSPATGPLAGGTLVNIYGQKFTGVTGVTGVKFGANNATSYTFVNDGHIVAIAPAGTGTVQVIVTTPQGASPDVAADNYVYA